MRPRSLSNLGKERLGAFVAGLLDLGAGVSLDALELVAGDWKIDVVWTWDGIEHGMADGDTIVGRVAFKPEQLETIVEAAPLLVEELGKAATRIASARAPVAKEA